MSLVFLTSSDADFRPLEAYFTSDCSLRHPCVEEVLLTLSR